ncbi:PH domain-containing protein [Aliikangiella maris]|uniref:PH domain-containing protein n=2 Tax=Aliikangiella maris TaxID=3162458 RepID=A0ABV3MID1_9GAMM
MNNNAEDVSNQQLIEAQWYRLSPLSICFFVFKFSRQLFKDALPALVPLFAVVVSGNSSTSVLSIAGALLVILIGLFAILQYWFFKYSIQGERILVHEGVLKKYRHNIHCERIQNINVLQPFYFKFFKLVILNLDTAGSAASEISLPGINQIRANNIQRIVFNNSQSLRQNIQNHLDDIPSTPHTNNEVHVEITALNEGENSQQANPQLSNRQLLVKTRLIHLVQYGLTSNNIFWFFAAITPLLNSIDDLLEKYLGKENINQLVGLLGGGYTGGILLISITILGIVFGAICFSILGAIIKYYQYELSLNTPTLKRKSGLLTQHEESVNLSKFQAIIRQCNWVGVLLQRQNLTLKQVSLYSSRKSAAQQLFVVPSLNFLQVDKISHIVFDNFSFSVKLTPVSRRYILSAWLKLMILPHIILIIVSLRVEASYMLNIIPAIFLGCFLIAYGRWRKAQYAINDEFIVVQSGLLGFRQIGFPLFKVQHVTIQQSIFQKRHNLASVFIRLASNKIVIPFIPLKVAQECYDRISFQIETTTKRWF